MDLRKKALVLSVFTVVYNIIEGAISIGFGFLFGSIALVSFGLDSFIESISGCIMIWRFSIERTDEDAKKVESIATKLVGMTFFLLAAYVLYEAGTKLYFQEQPNPSIIGIVIAAISLIVMKFLYSSKLELGKKLNSKSLLADAKETKACMFLSAALLLGVGLNYLPIGMWYADPIAGLFIAGYLIKEGIETFS